jgi:hypothetical protein
MDAPAGSCAIDVSQPDLRRRRLARRRYVAARRGWALVLGVAYLANAKADSRFASVAAATVDAAIGV